MKTHMSENGCTKLCNWNYGPNFRISHLLNNVKLYMAPSKIHQCYRKGKISQIKRNELRVSLH